MAASSYKTWTPRIDKISPALMIKKEDLEDLYAEWLRVPQWIRAHATITRPAHRYEGALSIEDHCLVFQGRDAKERTGFKEMIPLGKITEISLGLKRHFRVSCFSHLPKLKPLIIHYQTDNGRQIAYLFTDFNRQSGSAADNQGWYETLKGCVDGNGHSEEGQSSG